MRDILKVFNSIQMGKVIASLHREEDQFVNQPLREEHFTTKEIWKVLGIILRE